MNTDLDHLGAARARAGRSWGLLVQIVGLLMVQTSNRDTDRDFENVVMQAIVD